METIYIQRLFVKSKYNNGYQNTKKIQVKIKLC